MILNYNYVISYVAVVLS